MEWNEVKYKKKTGIFYLEIKKYDTEKPIDKTNW